MGFETRVRIDFKIGVALGRVLEIGLVSCFGIGSGFGTKVGGSGSGYGSDFEVRFRDRGHSRVSAMRLG